MHLTAAFRRLCVETHHHDSKTQKVEQPPSGGCVLKPQIQRVTLHDSSAAFRRLCVETFLDVSPFLKSLQPPSGGCVLKLALDNQNRRGGAQPPSGGCVLKLLF